MKKTKILIENETNGRLFRLECPFEATFEEVLHSLQQIYYYVLADKTKAEEEHKKKEEEEKQEVES